MCNHSRSVEVSTAPSQRGARNPFPLPVQERQWTPLWVFPHVEQV